MIEMQNATGPISAARAKVVGQRRCRGDLGRADATTQNSFPPSSTMIMSKSCITLQPDRTLDISPSASGVAQPSRAGLTRAASAPLIVDVGEPLGSGAQAVVCLATLSSSREPVALVIGKQPIPHATRRVLETIARKRPRHVVAVLHSGIGECMTAVHEQPPDRGSIAPPPLATEAGSNDSVAVQVCVCSLADILRTQRHRCTRKGFQEAVQSMVSNADVPLVGPPGECEKTPRQSSSAVVLDHVDAVLDHADAVRMAAGQPSRSAISALDSNDGASEAFLAGLARHILIGLRSLHALGIAHNDVKVSNVLFDEHSGSFLLGDLLNASHPDDIDRQQHPQGEDHRVHQHRRSIRRHHRPFRTDIKSFALLLLHVATTLNSSAPPPGEVHDAIGGGRSSHHVQPTTQALRVAVDGALTGCIDWVPWDAVATVIRSAPSPFSDHFCSFLKNAFCGPCPLGQSDSKGPSQNPVECPGEADELLRHPFLAHYGRTNEQWKQLLKTAFSTADATVTNAHENCRRSQRSRSAANSAVVVSPPTICSSANPNPFAALFHGACTTATPMSSPTMDDIASNSLRFSASQTAFPPHVPAAQRTGVSSSRSAATLHLRQPPRR